MNGIDFELIHHFECLFSSLFCVEKKFCNSFSNFLLKEKEKEKEKEEQTFWILTSRILECYFFLFSFSLFWFWGRMSEGGEEEWKTRILVNKNWSYLVRRLNDSTSKVIFLIQEKLSEEELVFPFGGALYFPPRGICTFSTEELDEEVETFEKFVRFVGGIEGKGLGIWAEVDDRGMKDTMFEKLRLKERNCEWFWDYIGDDGERIEDVYLRICKFFEENTHQQCQFKPAKK